MAAKKKVDYEVIEPGWRAGIKSVAQLAEEYAEDTGVSVSRAAIIKHFDKLGIPRYAKPGRSAAPVDVHDPLSEAGFVYVVYLDDSASERVFKIGMTSAFPSRLEAHQCGSPFKLMVACAYYVGNMRETERLLHNRFAANRILGEWFRLSDDDLREIVGMGLLV